MIPSVPVILRKCTGSALWHVARNVQMIFQRFRVRLMFAWRRLDYKLYQRTSEYLHYILITLLIYHDQMTILIYNS